jgi:CHAT domain-containing protein
MWVPLLPVLTATHSVTMIDAIDEVGKSVQTKPSTKSADLVAWLDEALRALDIQRSAVVAAVSAIIGRDESVHNGPKTATNLRRQLPEARIELVHDAGHGVLQDQPEIVDKLLTDFFQLR